MIIKVMLLELVSLCVLRFSMFTENIVNDADHCFPLHNCIECLRPRHTQQKIISC